MWISRSGLSDLEEDVLLGLAEQIVALAQKGQSAAGARFDVLAIVKQWSSWELLPSRTPAEVLRAVERLIDDGYLAPDELAKKHGLTHDSAGVHVTSVGLVAAKQMSPELEKPPAARAQKIQLELGQGLREGVLQGPRCKSDSRQLDRLVRDRMPIVPILLLLFWERRWYVKSLGVVLRVLEERGHVRMHVDSTRAGITDKWLHDCVKALAEVVAGLEVLQRQGERSVVVLGEAMEFEFVVEGVPVTADEVREILADRCGLRGVDPDGIKLTGGESAGS